MSSKDADSPTAAHADWASRAEASIIESVMFGGFEQVSHAKVSARSKGTLSLAKVELRQRSESTMVTLAHAAKKCRRTFGGKDLTSVKSPIIVPLAL